MLGAVLGDLQTEVGGVHNRLLYAFDFVSEYKGVLAGSPAGEGVPPETRATPGLEFDRIDRLLHCNDRVSFRLESGYGLERVGIMLPRHGLFGPEGCLMDFG